MLRITLPKRKGPPVFVLEGKLAGLWVKELIHLTSQIGPETTAAFDLEDVLFVDSAGEEALLRLGRLGATFIANNVYGKGLCQRLHLHYATRAKTGAPSQLQAKSGKAPAKASLP